MCGRDGDPMMAHHPVMELSTSWRGPRSGPRSVARAETGTWTAAGAGAGEYRYPAQCIFYYSENDDCCATKKGWTTANPHVAGASSTHCTDRFGAMSDHWNTKHRTWKVAHAPAPWPPAANPAWPTKGIVPRTLSYTVTWSMVFASNADVETPTTARCTSWTCSRPHAPRPKARATGRWRCSLPAGSCPSVGGRARGVNNEIACAIQRNKIPNAPANAPARASSLPALTSSRRDRRGTVA